MYYSRFSFSSQVLAINNDFVITIVFFQELGGLQYSIQANIFNGEKINKYSMYFGSKNIFIP